MLEIILDLRRSGLQGLCEIASNTTSPGDSHVLREEVSFSIPFSFGMSFVMSSNFLDGFLEDSSIR